MYCIPVNVCIMTVLVLSWAQFWFCAVFRDVVLISVYCIPVGMCIITVLSCPGHSFAVVQFSGMLYSSVCTVYLSVCVS